MSLTEMSRLDFLILEIYSYITVFCLVGLLVCRIKSGNLHTF